MKQSTAESVPNPEPQPVDESKPAPAPQEESQNSNPPTRMPDGPPVKYPPFINATLYPPCKEMMDKYRSEQSAGNSPHKKLELEFIYGAGVKGVQGNLLYMNSDATCLIYPAAATNVVFNIREHTQKTLRVHNDDITCIAQHPKNKDIFASGQTGKDDYVVVWDSKEMKELARLNTAKAFNPGGVLDLTFNPSNPSQLAVVGGTDHECKIQVWDWENGKELALATVTQKETHALAWSPEGEIVWMGDGQIKFIEFDGTSLDVHTGILGDKGKRQRFLSIDFSPSGDALIGTESGMIYRFKKRRLVTKKRAHKGTVRSICSTSDGFISAGKDGTVKAWRYGAFEGDAYQVQDDFDEEDFDDEEADADSISIIKNYVLGDYTRSVTVNLAESHAYVFEADGDVLELDLFSGNTRHLLYGHNGARSELWGLDVSQNPEKPYFCTAGDDGRVLIFSYETKKLLGQLALRKTELRGVALSPDAKELAATSTDGDLYIASVDDVISSYVGKVQKIDTDDKTDLEVKVVKYSPDGKYLAVGSHDTAIHIYSVGEGYKEIATLKDHSAVILGLDWSKDSKFLRSVCAAKELLFWNGAPSFERDTMAADNAGIEWATETCIFTWGVRGMWDPSYNDASDINACDVDFNSDTLAFADDLGKLNIARYPTMTDSVPVDQYTGHCSHLTRCRFSADGKYLFSTGGADLCTFQWKVEDK